MHDLSKDQYNYVETASIGRWHVEVTFSYGFRTGFRCEECIGGQYYLIFGVGNLCEISRMWSNTEYCNSMSLQDFMNKMFNESNI